MNAKLRTIWNFVRNIISPTIEQKVKSWLGNETSIRPIHIELQSSQNDVNIAMNLLLQQRSLAASAPIVVLPSGNMQREKHSDWLALNKPKMSERDMDFNGRPDDPNNSGNGLYAV